MTKSKLKRTGFISFTVPYNSSSSKAVGQELKQGKKRKAGADAEAMR